MSKSTKLIISLVVLVVVVVFFVYSPMTVQPAQDEVMANIKAKIEAIWNDGNYDAVAEIIAEDCIHHHSSLPEPITTLDAYTQFVKNNEISFPDFKLTLSDFYVSSDNMAFLFWEASGTNTGPFPDGSPATGNAVKIWGMAANKIVDGKIVESWVTFNQFDMFRQLGMFGKPEMEEMHEMDEETE